MVKVLLGDIELIINKGVWTGSYQLAVDNFNAITKHIEEKGSIFTHVISQGDPDYRIAEEVTKCLGGKITEFKHNSDFVKNRIY